MRNKSITIISSTLFTISFSTNSQKLINSPFSRFNIGTLEPTGSFRSMAMGGIGAGINMEILFGQLRRTSQYNFTEYTDAYNNNSTEKLRMSGVNFDYDIQYSGSVKNNYFLNAGVSLKSDKNYNSNFEHISFNYTSYGSQDTISYISDDKSKAFIPGTLRMGISFGQKDKFTTGIDFVTTSWSKTIIPGMDGYAADTKSILFGAEFIPEKYSNYSFLKRIEYRLGGNIADNYLIVNGEQVKEIGASFGLGIPMRRSNSKTNLFFDFTRKSGSAINSLHTENYYSMGISPNLYDFWFLKRKYD